jgi:DUF4097 and DUF4098 domain-containing protein YvlB
MRLVALVLALSSSACVDLVGADIGRYVEREEKRYTVTGRPELILSTFDGHIEVRPWDRSEVEVVIEKHAGSKESAASLIVDAHQAGSQITVDVRAPHNGHFGFFSGRSARLLVSVPRGTDLTARSGDGSIDVEGVDGKIDLHSSDGRIEARAVAGDVSVSTSDGSIRLDGHFTALHARTSDGRINVTTSSARAERDWDLSTSDGTITLDVPKGFGAELDARTSDGRIHLEEVAVSNVTGPLRKNAVRGRLGDGGAAVRMRTSDGSITLRSGRPSGTADSR